MSVDGIYLNMGITAERVTDIASDEHLEEFESRRNTFRGLSNLKSATESTVLHVTHLKVALAS